MAAFEEAFNYPKNKYVYISLDVLLEIAFVADQLKCFMFKLNFCL